MIRKLFALSCLLSLVSPSLLFAKPSVAFPALFNCGPGMSTYRVRSLDNGAFGGVRCVKFTEGSPDGSTPRFAWYGEGRWNNRSYRHVGQAFRSPGQPNVRIGFASDIHGNGEFANGNFDGNLIITLVDTNTIRVTGAWNEEWQRVNIVNYNPLPAPSTCGSHFDEYHVSDLTNSRSGSGLRCLMRIGPSARTWYGNGEWNGNSYAHLGTLSGLSGIGASDLCRLGTFCNQFSYGSLILQPAGNGFNVTGAWREKWRR